MVKQCWLCKDCNKPYYIKKDALNCEKRHEKHKLEQEKIHKENQKMVFGKGVKITKNHFDTHGGGVDFKIPKNCDLIILMGNKGGGYVPYQCLLPHQVYVTDLREAFEEHGFEVIYVVGINSESPFQIAYQNKYGFDRWKNKKRQAKGCKR